MLHDETVIIAKKVRVVEIRDLQRAAQNLLQMSVPALVESHLREEQRVHGAFLAEYANSRQVQIGTTELGEMCSTGTAAATRACREGRVEGAKRGPNGRWRMTQTDGEEYAKRRRPGTP